MTLASAASRRRRFASQERHDFAYKSLSRATRWIIHRAAAEATVREIQNTGIPERTDKDVNPRHPKVKTVKVIVNSLEVKDLTR